MLHLKACVPYEIMGLSETSAPGPLKSKDFQDNLMQRGVGEPTASHTKWKL